MSKGNTKAQNLTGIISTESILITRESNWIQTKTVIWFVLFVLFFWLNKTNQINQINQINKTNQIDQRDQMNQTNQVTRQTGLVPDVQAIEVLLCQNGFCAACQIGEKWRTMTWEIF